MSLLLKTTLKNTFGKPFRSLIVIFSIFVCSFAAMFCFDLVKTETGLIENIVTDVFGDADFGIYSYIGTEEDLPADLPEYKALPVYDFRETVYVGLEGEYYVVTTDEFTVRGVNTKLAYEMGYLDSEELRGAEALVTDKLANQYGYTIGNSICIHDNAGDPHYFIVSKIVESDQKKLLFRGKNIVVNEESAKKLSCYKTMTGTMLINILDDSKLDEVETILQENYGKDNVVNYNIAAETQSYMAELFGLLFILFAVAFLLVIFITASICERIVSERMSFIGTLRSLGMSSVGTIWILLMENISYALFGSIPGVLLYVAIRPSMMDSLFNLEVSGEKLNLTIPELSVFLTIGVILGAILVECLIPLKAILKAINTSIRDIIFDNRDTEYKMSKSSIITGIVLLAVSAVMFFIRNLICAGICLICSVMALALLYPLILKWIVGLLDKFAEKRGDAKASLAFREAVSRKSTVGSGVLCATSAAMCIIITTLSGAMTNLFDPNLYDCNVIVECNAMSKDFSFVPYLEGVTETEFVYGRATEVRFEDEEKEKAASVFGYPDGGYTLYNGLHEMPESIEPGQICVDKSWAKQKGYKIGDTIKITFDPLGVLPIDKEFTIVSYYKMDRYESLKNDFAICESDYKEIFHDNPGYLLIRSENPEGTRDDVKKYAVGKYINVRTRQEIEEESASDIATSKRVFNILIAVAFLMTFIGMVSNQTIGFEGRKKECAVMLSTSMTKRALGGILFREMLITSFVSATTGALVGILMFGVIKQAIDSSDMVVLPVELDVMGIIRLWIMMTVIFTLSVLFPVKNMRKMKLAEQLKYE